MANTLFDLGYTGLLDGTIDLDTDTISIALLDTATADTGIKAITGATNATPIVITATSHGFANGDRVFIDGVGGNLAANGLWKVASQAANTFELTRIDGTNVVGSGTYTSGGYAICLGPSAAGDNYDDFSAALVGAKVNLASKTLNSPRNGVFDAADTTFTSVTGATVEVLVIFEDSGTESTSKMLMLITGKHIVKVAITAAASATSISVDPLVAGIASGATLTFSNGASATLSGAASAGARSLAVNSLAAQIQAEHVALAAASPASGLPVTPNGGNISVTYDSGSNRIFAISPAA